MSASQDAIAYVYENVGANRISTREDAAYVYENVGALRTPSRDGTAYVYENVLDGPPADDNLTNATDMLPYTGGTLPIDNTLSTSETGEPLAADGNTVWYRYFTDGVPGNVTIDTAATPLPQWDTTIQVFSATTATPTMAQLTLVVYDDNSLDQPGAPISSGTSLVSFAALGELHYFVQVDSYNSPGQRDDGVLTWTFTARPPGVVGGPQGSVVVFNDSNIWMLDPIGGGVIKNVVGSPGTSSATCVRTQDGAIYFFTDGAAPSSSGTRTMTVYDYATLDVLETVTVPAVPVSFHPNNPEYEVSADTIYVSGGSSAAPKLAVFDLEGNFERIYAWTRVSGPEGFLDASTPESPQRVGEDIYYTSEGGYLNKINLLTRVASIAYDLSDGGYNRGLQGLAYRESRNQLFGGVLDSVDSHFGNLFRFTIGDVVDIVDLAPFLASIGPNASLVTPLGNYEAPGVCVEPYYYFTYMNNGAVSGADGPGGVGRMHMDTLVVEDFFKLDNAKYVGLTIGAFPPTGLPSATACSLRVGVYASDATTLIANIPRRRNVKWLNEVNTPGSGQFEIHLEDPILAAYPNLLDQYNIVKIFFNGVPIKAWVIEAVNPTRVASGEVEANWVVVSGRGAISVLENAIVYPEYGLRELVSEDRFFNFAAKDGPWRNALEWTTPVGVLWPNDTTARHTYPKNWPDPAAYELWSTSPNAAAPVGINWFRGTFTVATQTSVIIYATADNQFVAYMDGEVVLSSGTNTTAFRTRYDWRMTLAPGEHTFAAMVTNVGSVPNSAMFMCSIYRTNTAGAQTSDNVFRSTPSNFLVKAYGTAPGWNGASVLRELILEAQDREVDSVLPITFGFDNVRDSGGTLWTDIQERIVKVATTDLANLASQVIELTLDLDLDPNFVLHAWKKRGVDRSQTVRILPSRDILAGAGTINSGKVRNQAILKYEGGWMELFSAASKDEYGRREVGISLGTSSTVAQTTLAGTALVREVARPEITIPVTYTCIKGPQPHINYDLGDTITTINVYSGLTKARVMSIAGSETNEGIIQWDLAFYPQIDDDAIDTVVVAVGGAFKDASALYQSEVLSDSPWAYWRLTETASPLKDISGHKRNLTVTGSPTYAQAGPVDRSAIFTYHDPQFAETATNVFYTTGITTVEAWVNVTSDPTTRSNIIGMAIGAGTGLQHDKEMGIDSNGHLYWYIFKSGAHTLTSTFALTHGTWYHVAASIGAKGQKLYINGVLNRSAATPITSEAGYNKRVMLRAGGGSGYNGLNVMKIAEPAVYFQQLLDSRIKSHFDASGFTP